MNKRLLALLLISTLCSAPLFPASAYAKGKSLEQAIEQVRKQTGGRILDASTVDKNGKRVHQVKVLTPDGRVKVITIPAE